MNLSQWEPFREVEEFMSRMTPALTRWRRETNGSAAIQWSPTADISETDKEFLICAELPGIAREDVKLSIEDGVLTLSGERQHEKRTKPNAFIASSAFKAVSPAAFLCRKPLIHHAFTLNRTMAHLPYTSRKPPRLQPSVSTSRSADRTAK